MNDLINQLDLYNKYLNLDKLTSAEILEKGKWLTTMLGIKNKMAPALFYTYNDFLFINYVNVWYDDYYKSMTTNNICIQLIKSIMYGIIHKFKIKLCNMRSDADFNYADPAYIRFSIDREEYNLLTQFDIPCYDEYEIMQTD